jgi:glycosyltransferase involved in cell wall biosynthesis
VCADRISVIGWGVDRREFHPEVEGGSMRVRLDIPVDAPVVLSPRRWHSNCNITTVIAAHEQLSDDVYLVLKRLAASEPATIEEIESAVEASTARSRIRIVNEQPPEELPELFAASDVVVSLCLTDGTPVSVLEAMAVGRPVVALQNASLAEWIAAPGGELVSAADPRLVAAAMRRFLSDAALRDRAAEHNQAVVVARGDRDTELARMDEIYRRLGQMPARSCRGA